jgi:hypothetical protein
LLPSRGSAGAALFAIELLEAPARVADRHWLAKVGKLLTRLPCAVTGFRGVVADVELAGVAAAGQHQQGGKVRKTVGMHWSLPLPPAGVSAGYGRK